MRSDEVTWNIARAEQFRLLGAAWSVTAAKEILVAVPREVHHVEVMALRGLLGLIHTDEHAAWDADLSVPLIAVQDESFHGGVLVIDGWHRVHRATMEGMDALPCVVLTLEESRSARLP